MATYRLTSPDGENFEVTAPEGATEEAVLRYAQAMWKAKPKTLAAPKKADPTEDMSVGEQALAGAGKAFVDLGRGIGQMTGLVSQAEVDEAKRLDAPLMNTGAGLAGNIGANMLTALVPGGNTVKGAALVGGALSALQPVAGVNGADELLAKKIKETALGGALGAGGALAAKGIGKGLDAAKGRMANLSAKVEAKAAADAAAETASARSAAGRAAQDAYKQLEHLRELDAVGALTPEQSQLFKELSEELAKKAQEKLVPAAAMKKETAKLYREAIETETERAVRLAADRLSGKEAKNQVMARVKRYGPAAIGGALGGAVFGGAGAVAGVPIGLYLRPAIQATMRMAKNPAVQYQMLRPIAGSGLLGDLAENPRLLGLLAPSIYAAQE